MICLFKKSQENVRRKLGELGELGELREGQDNFLYNKKFIN